jgi:transposase InsO family protein
LYGRDFGARLARVGVSDVRTPIRAPRANSIAERLIRTVRQECLDHVVVLDERHLHTILSEFVRYYNKERPHRALALESPVPQLELAREGPVRSRPVLSGLHHIYYRAA